MLAGANSRRNLAIDLALGAGFVSKIIKDHMCGALGRDICEGWALGGVGVGVFGLWGKEKSLRFSVEYKKRRGRVAAP